MPPKWASAWSAMMTESAIVISAWRSSCPWFQRRKNCCIRSPRTPIASDAATSGTTQSARPACELPKAETASPPVIRSCSSKAKNPASMYSDPCAMLTTRISPKMSVKPLATTK